MTEPELIAADFEEAIASLDPELQAAVLAGARSRAQQRILERPSRVPEYLNEYIPKLAKSYEQSVASNDEAAIRQALQRLNEVSLIVLGLFASQGGANDTREVVARDAAANFSLLLSLRGRHVPPVELYERAGLDTSALLNHAKTVLRNTMGGFWSDDLGGMEFPGLVDVLNPSVWEREAVGYNMTHEAGEQLLALSKAADA